MFKANINKNIFILLITIIGITFGDSGLASLKIVPGVREAAMASTGVASAQGPQAIYFNPALTSRYNRFLANLYYAKWFLGTHHQSLFVVRPTKIVNLGLGVVNFYYGDVENRDNYPTDGPKGYFNPQDFSFFLALSRALDKRTAIGVSGKYYFQKIFDQTASSGGLDIGLKFDVLPQMSLGFSIINFGSTMRFIREKFWLPTEAKAGASYDLPIGKNHLISALDLGYLPYDKKFNGGLGAEFAYNNLLFIRAGVRPFSETGKISTGLGVKLNNFRLEYSFSPYAYNLGTTHRFSVGYGY